MKKRLHRDGGKAANGAAGSSIRRPASGPTATEASLWENGRWALRLAWDTNRALTAAFLVLYTLLALVPAIQAIATRGLVNAALAGLKGSHGSLGVMVPWLVLGLGATLADGLGILFRDFASQRLEDELNVELNSTILEHTAKLDLGFFEEPASQDVLFCAKQNSARNLLRFVQSLLSFASNLLQMGSLLAILAVIEPLILVIAPAAIPYMWFQWRLSEIKHRLQKSRATKRRWTQYFVSSLTEANSVPETRILGLAPFMIEKFRALMAEFRRQDDRVLVRSTRAAGLFSTAASLATFALFARVAIRVLQGVSTMGDLAIFGAAAGRLRTTLQRQVDAVSAMREETLNISDLRELLSTQPTIVPGPKPPEPSRFRGEIEFRDVSFTYPGSDRPALRDLSLTIRAGETLALVGANGSGKSTLVKLLARFYDPDRGRVLLDSHDLRELHPDHLCSEIALVFQNFRGYEASLADNIAYADWRQLMGDTESIRRIAEQNGLAPLAESLPEGYDTLLGRRFGTQDLSRGQWQRVAIGRAFARPASIIILDEPTSNLDPRAEQEVLARINELKRDRTLILIAHRLSAIQIADRIAVMRNGTIVEVGSPEELTQQGGEYANLSAEFRKRELNLNPEARLSRAPNR